jgi:hypothetical protein
VRGIRILQTRQELHRPGGRPDDCQRIQEVKMVGNYYERSRFRQAFPTHGAQIAQKSKGESDPLAKKKADRTKTGVGELS